VTLRKKRTTNHAVAKPTMDDYLACLHRMNRASAEFLKIDVEMALTFVQNARQTSDLIRRKRNRHAARRAFYTVTNLMKRVKLNEEDLRTLALGLEQLRSELEELGEQF